MRKTGLQMLLSSMGIEIEPEELMRKYNEAKDIMPKLAAFVTQLDARLARIETMLESRSQAITSLNERLVTLESQESKNAIDTGRNRTVERGNFGRTIPSDIDSYPAD